MSKRTMLVTLGFAAVVATMAMLVAIYETSRSTVQERVEQDVTDPASIWYGRKKWFKSGRCIRAAAYLQSLGKKEAMKRLRASTHDEVILLCGILFEPTTTVPVTTLSLGMPVHLGGTSSKDWPLGQVELIEGVPFAIVRGNVLTGRLDNVENYVKWYADNWTWSETPVIEKTREEMLASLRKLLNSPKWTRQLLDDEVRFLSEQIDLESPR